MRTRNVWIALLLLALGVGACGPAPTPISALPDGLYIPPSCIDYMLRPGEDELVQAAIVRVGREEPQPTGVVKSWWASQVQLVDEAGRAVSPSHIDVSEGPATDSYRMLTLVMHIPNLETGKHIFNTLRLVDGQGAVYEYNIGEWVFNVFDEPVSEGLKVGRQSWVTEARPGPILDAELTNLTDGEVTVGDLRMGQGAGACGTTCTLGRVFADWSDSSSELRAQDRTRLAPGQTKTFSFFCAPQEGREAPEFIAFRPLLSFTGTGGAQQQILLRQSIYTVFVTSDEQVLADAARGKPVRVYRQEDASQP